MKHASLTAEPRAILGKKVAQLRRAGKLPANIYGQNAPSTAITLDAHDFGLVYRHILPTTIIDLRVSGQSRPVLLDKAAINPRSGQVIHVEFKQINMREKVHAAVTIVGVGKSEAIARGDILMQALDSVDVRALPDEFPNSIEVDVSVLVDLHSAIHVRDLPIDRSRIEILTPGDELVFKLTAPHVRDGEATTETAAPTTESSAAGESSTER